MTLPLEHHQSLLHAATPALRYAPGEDFAAWQARARQKLQDLLGLPLPSCAPELIIHSTREQDGVTRVEFTFASEPGYRAAACFLYPTACKGKLPLAVCLQGHSTGMHISLGEPKYPGDEDVITGGDRDFAVRALREGYCVAVLEQRAFGVCGGTPEGPDCFRAAMTALLLGRTLLGERVWDVMRLLDVLEQNFPQADMQNILCMGNSGGGTTTFYAACLEQRIRYAMPSCAVCSYAPSIGDVEHCSCNYVPAIARFFDMGDLAGLIAPRALVIVAGRMDPIFPLKGVQEAYAQAQTLYAACGAPDRLKLVLGDGGHRFYADAAWPVLHALAAQGEGEDAR